MQNRYSPANMPQAYDAFLRAHLAYKAREIDELRAAQYHRLDEHGHVYLDYTGGSLHSDQQILEHMEMLRQGVFGNPHSSNPTSMEMTKLDEHARAYVLEFFNASPEEYIVVFTPNASGALKHVGESFPFGSGDHYALTYDNHNSVNGIREFARRKGADVTYIPVVAPDMHIDETHLKQVLNENRPNSNRLFAYPAQSNFTGVQHSLEWIAYAQERGWLVLLDAAAFVPTNRLDLSRWHPDFVDLSFYKIFGYPTGVGGLLMRKAVLPRLHRPWYAGGTISFSSVQGMGHYLTPGSASFEDGTINYLSLPAVEIGLKHIESIGLDNIHERVMALTAWLIEQLVSLCHSNGRQMIKIYGPTSTKGRGATVQFNFFDPDGELWDCSVIEHDANKINLSIRTGCH
jgi:selenocysteine lyase/cysteine desulfurase